MCKNILGQQMLGWGAPSSNATASLAVRGVWCGRCFVCSDSGSAQSATRCWWTSAAWWRSGRRPQANWPTSTRRSCSSSPHWTSAARSPAAAAAAAPQWQRCWLWRSALSPAPICFFLPGCEAGRTEREGMRETSICLWTLCWWWRKKVATSWCCVVSGDKHWDAVSVVANVGNMCFCFLDSPPPPLPPHSSVCALWTCGSCQWTCKLCASVHSTAVQDTKRKGKLMALFWIRT